ncbi:hypothetical protein GCM10009737_37540 [Nocardioides lentus]|uniref:TY-Chap N-terminal domain-containing protein n=1 Tax=Nocardioides lentus TaxID=338077 RepID=A0ABN2PU60_9ACTN
MRGDWDDLARRLTGAALSLDVYDAVVVGDTRPPARRSFLGLGPARRPDVPRRWVQVTAAQSVLVGECVGARSWGGGWDLAPDVVDALLRQGWEKPWSTDSTALWREAPLQAAPRLARSLVRALQTMGCEVAGLEVERTREEPEP